MPNLVHGKDVILSVDLGGGLSPVLCCTNCSLTATTETVSKTTVTSGRNREFATRLNEYGVSLTGIAVVAGEATSFTLLKAQLQGRVLPSMLTCTDEAGQAAVIEASLIITSSTLNGDVGAFADFQMETKATGPIKLNGEIIAGAGGNSGGVDNTNNPDVQTYYYTAIGGELSFSDTDMLLGKRIIGFFRETTPVTTVITTGVPTAKQVLYKSSLAEFDFPADNPPAPGEPMMIQYANL